MTPKHYSGLVFLAFALAMAAWDAGHGTGKLLVALVLFVIGFARLEVFGSDKGDNA